MVFSSLLFMFIYLPVVLGIYFLTPVKLRNIFLLIANLVFYGWGEPVYILIMLVSIVVDYSHGLLVEKFREKDKIARYFVGQSVVINLGILFFFKYFDFFLINLQKVLPILSNIEPLGLALPIGISFYTFQTMSYTIDIYRGDAKAQRKITDFGVFVTLFPQLIAGPIVKYKDIATELTDRTTSIDKFADGVKLFSLGLFKKVILANNIGMLWEVYKVMPENELTVLGAWLGAIAATLQIFFDFSGYSDMARGLGRMLGFHFLENFNYPLVSKSITEFWRRWHISLGTWFREYVYIPLGGNRKGLLCTFRNIVVVWFLTGFWHGAEWNFALWGIYFAIILIIEKAFLLNILKKIPSIFAHLYTLVLVFVSFILFSIEGNGTEVLSYVGRMFGLNGTAMFDTDAVYYLGNYGVVLVVCGLFAIPITRNMKIPQKVRDVSSVIMVALTLVVSTAYLVDATFNPFMYFRF